MKKPQMVSVFGFLVSLTISYIVLFDFQYNAFNSWMDYVGNIDINDNLIKNLFAWNSNGLGAVNFSSFTSLPYYLYTKIIYYLFGIEFGTFFVPFFLIFIIAFTSFHLSYLLLGKLAPTIAIVPIFVFNPILLYYLFSRGTMTFLVAIIGINLSLIFYYKFLSRKNGVYLLLLIFSSLLLSHPFLFSFYVAIFFFLLVLHKQKKYVFQFVVLVPLLHAFWILPFLSGTFLVGDKSTALGAHTSSYIERATTLSPLQNSFLFLGRSSQSFMSEFYNADTTFVIFSIFFLWISVVYFSLIDRRSANHKIFIILIWVICFFLLLFSVGPRGNLGWTYKVLYENIPAFSFFRSFQNVLIFLFYFIVFLGISISRYSRGMRVSLYIVSLSLLMSFILYRDVSFTSKSVALPQGYLDTKSIVDQDKYSSKILVLPASNYDYYLWDSDSQDKYFLQAFFSENGVIMARKTINDATLKNLFNSISSNSNTGDLLGNYGIKYVLLRHDLRDRDTDYNELPTILPYDKIIESPHISLFKISPSIPFLQTKGLTFKKNNPVSYSLQIDNFTGLQDLTLKENYSRGWKLFLLPYSNTTLCDNPKIHLEADTSECEKDTVFLPLNLLNFVRKSSIFEEAHTSNQYGMNLWSINAKHITENYPRSFYFENEQGLISIRMIAFYWPQVYVYFGFFITTVSALYLLYMVLMSLRLRNIQKT